MQTKQAGKQLFKGVKVDDLINEENDYEDSDGDSDEEMVNMEKMDDGEDDDDDNDDADDDKYLKSLKATVKKSLEALKNSGITVDSSDEVDEDDDDEKDDDSLIKEKKDNWSGPKQTNIEAKENNEEKGGDFYGSGHESDTDNIIHQRKADIHDQETNLDTDGDVAEEEEGEEKV